MTRKVLIVTKEVEDDDDEEPETEWDQDQTKTEPFTEIWNKADELKSCVWFYFSWRLKKYIYLFVPRCFYNF